MIQRKEIEEVFGELLGRIGSADLRRKVIDAWMLGIERGGWQSMEQLRAMPFTLRAESSGVNFIEHTLAVTRGAAGLAEAQVESYAKMPYLINMDRLIAGALLHDVGKLVEIERRPDGTYGFSESGRRTRHPVSGALLAAEAGLPEDVLNTIARHSTEGEGAPRFVETVLIHQADFATFDPLVLRGKGLLIE